MRVRIGISFACALVLAAATDVSCTQFESAPNDAGGSGDASAESSSTDAPPGTPTRIAATQGGTTLVVDSAHVYWADGTTLKRVPVNGGPGEGAFGTAAATITSLAINGTYVVWTDSNEFHAKRKAALPGAVPDFTYSGGPEVVIDDSDVVSMTSVDSIWQIPINKTSSTVAVLGQAHLLRFAGGKLYFLGVLADGGSDVDLWWCPASGCADAYVPNGPIATKLSPIALAAGGGKVVWIDPTGTIWAAPGDAASPPSILVTGQATASSIAADGVSAYYTTSDSIWKVPLAGGSPQQLATQQQLPSSIAVNGTAVFWLSSRNQIFRLAF